MGSSEFGATVAGEDLQALALGPFPKPARNVFEENKPVSFRTPPAIEDPGEEISKLELQREAGRQLVLDRIHRQGLLIAQQESLGGQLSRLERFLLFQSQSGVSDAALAAAEDDAARANLIQSGLERSDKFLIDVAGLKPNLSRLGSFADAGVAPGVSILDRAAEALGGFQLNAEGNPERDSLLSRIERGAAGQRGNILTSAAGVVPGATTGGVSLAASRAARARASAHSSRISSARTDEIGQRGRTRGSKLGRIFSGPGGLLENNILGSNGDLSPGG